MAGEYNLSVILSATNRASGAIESFISSLNPIAGAALGMGVALAGIGVASGKMAGDFQQAMLSNVAHAGLAKSEFQSVSNAILAMAPAVGRSPIQLAEAMYPILSAFSGVQNQSAKSAIALDTLKMSFQAVAGTTVNGTDVANAAVGTFNALGLATENTTTNTARMKNLFDVMDLTVQRGNMQWGAYKNVISKLAVSIQGTGISFNEASAALSTMTNEGFSAQKAQTYLSNTFVTMAIKTDAVAKHAKKLKIAFDEQAYSSMNLAHKIGYLNEITGGNKQKILGLLNNNATALKTFNALSTGIKEYSGDLKAYGNAQGALATSFDTASQGVNFQMSQLKAAGEALMVTIGTKLLPVFSDLMKQIIPLVSKFSDWLVKSGALDTAANLLSGTLKGIVTVISTLVGWGFQLNDFFQKNQVAMDIFKSVVVGVGVAITLFAMTQIPALLISLGAWAVAQWTVAVAVLATAAPFILIGLIVAAVVLAIIVCYQNWGHWMDWLSGKSGDMADKTAMAHEKAKISAIDKTTQQKDGVLKQLEAERAGVLAKINSMADGAEKEREKMRLKAIDAQIKTTQGNIKELDNEKAQHQAKLKQLAADDLEARKNWYDRANDATTKWFDTWKGIIVKWYNSANDTATKWFNSWSGVVSRWVTDNLQRAGQMKDGFIAKLGQLKDEALSKAQQTVQGIASFFQNLPGMALKWGEDLIQNLINGISSMIPNLGSIASKAANAIASVLHFTKPDTGPLVTIDEWMPHMGQTLIEGLNEVAPKLQVAALKAASAVSSSFSAGGGTGAPMHLIDFVGDDYKGYASGMATTRKREIAAQRKEAKQDLAEEKKHERHTLALEKLQATLEKHIKALEEPSKAPHLKTAKERAAYAQSEAKKEASLQSEEAHIQKLEQQYHITVNHTGKGKWTKADAQELAKLIADQARLQSKHPQSASGRRH